MSNDPIFIIMATLGVAMAALYYIMGDDKSVVLFIINAAINIGVVALLYKIFMKEE